MKRIGINLLVVTERFGGAGRYGISLVNSLQRVDKKNKYFLIISKSIDYKIDIFNKNFEKILISIPFNIRILRILYEQFFLKYLVKKLNLDILHSISNIVPLINKINKKTDLILTVHDLIFLRDPARYSLLKCLYYNIFVRKSISIAKNIVAVSNFTKNDILNELKVNPERLKTIYTAADDIFKFYNLPREDWVLIISTLEPGKNIEFVIKSVRKRKIKVAGNLGWKYKNIIKMIERNKNVEYMGYSGERELANLINRSKLVIYSSKDEGFGLPIIESLSCGTPVIANDLPVFREIFKESIFYFKYPDSKQLEEKVNYIFSLNTKQYKKLQKRCIEFSKKFSWLKTARKTIKVYSSDKR